MDPALICMMLRTHRVRNSFFGGLMAVIMLIALCILAVYFGIARIRKARHYRKHTKYYRAVIQKIDSYTYEDYYKGHTHERKAYCIYFSWMDDEEGAREDMIELHRPKFWYMRKRKTAMIAVIRGKVKTKSAPVPMHFTLRKNATLLGSPRDERHVGISNTNPMYIPEERVMFLYQRIGHTFYTLFYVLIIMIPALLIPLMILLPLIVDLN